MGLNSHRRAAFSSPELTHQVARLVAIRFLMYLGAMSSYFIGVLGTLTYTLGAGVGDNAIAVGLTNLCLMFGGIKGGAMLDRLGPHRHVRLCIVTMIASGLIYQVVATDVLGVALGASLFGFAWGMADVVPRSYPAYLSDSRDDLKRINSLVTLAGNIALVLGPTIGGVIVLFAPTSSVFLFMMACSALALLPAWGFRGLRMPGEKNADRDSEGVVSAGFGEIKRSPVLTLLFWSAILSFMCYGAFDPLEALFYRDVLNVGAEWMGWLSALSGVGGVLGAVLAGLVPSRRIDIRLLLLVLAFSGAGCLVYVSTPFVAVACVGQLLLGVGFSMFGPIKDTLVQLHAPLDRIGRINAAMGAGYNAAGVLPFLAAPLLARMLGVQGTLIASGILVTAVPLCIFATRRREIAALARAEHDRPTAVEEDR